MNAGNKKTRKLNDTEKFVCAVEKDDNVKAMKHLEDILRKKAHKKIPLLYMGDILTLNL